jgi:hypothetical protein
VSDVFGTALWTINQLVALSQAGVERVNLHGDIRHCGTAKPDFAA